MVDFKDNRGGGDRIVQVTIGAEVDQTAFLFLSGESGDDFDLYIDDPTEVEQFFREVDDARKQWEAVLSFKEEGSPERKRKG